MKMCVQPQLYGKDILEFVQSSKNTIDAYSANENEMDNAALVPTSSEMRNVMKRMGRGRYPLRGLTPLDYFLWGYVKTLVYADKPQTLDHLEDNIRRVIADIRPQMLEKVIENWTSRLDYIRASRGSPMPEIIFKMQCHKIIFRIKKIMSIE
ncbi:hypothetical protein TNCV_3534911 [Trichonephila clavipes]|nr:hypothetical protein TNCV_3534911 [Trichonephila clavipes]